MRMVNLVGEIVLRRINPNTHSVVNVPLLIEKTEGRYLPSGKDQYRIVDALDGEVLIDELSTMREAKAEVLKLIVHGIDDQVEPLKKKKGD